MPKNILKKSVKIFFRVKNYCYICLTLKNKYSGEKGADDNIGGWPEKVSYLRNGVDNLRNIFHTISIKNENFLHNI